MEPTDSDKNRALDEFKETTSMQRFEAGLMFGQLTVYLAIFGILCNKIITDPPPMQTIVIGVALVGGMAIPSISRNPLACGQAYARGPHAR
jgi:hypothetical protein